MICVQGSNASKSIFVSVGMLTFHNAVQPLKAPRPIFVTLDGIVTLVNDLQSLNALFSISITLFGISTLVNELQFPNTP